MATQIVSEHAKVLDITYKLPNKHYIPVDMKYINIDNMTPLSTILLHCICFVCALRYQYAPDKEA